MSKRFDGWINLLTGLGGKRSAQKNTKHAKSERLDPDSAGDLFCDDGIARRAVRAFPKHATRRWCSFIGDEDGELEKLIRRTLRAKKMFRDAATKARTTGGAVVVLYCDDGIADPAQPLNIKTIKKITSWEIFDRSFIFPDCFYSNGIDAGKVEKWTVNRWNGGSATVHETRCLFFDGEEVTDRRRAENNGFGDSMYQSSGDSLRGLATAYGTAEGILSQFVTPIMKVRGLANAIATGQEEDIKKRVEIMAYSRSMINTLIIDAEEDWQQHTAAVTGLPDLLDRFGTYAAATTGIPVKILLGNQTAGMGSKDDADTRIFHEEVNSYQTEELEPLLLRLVDICCACSEYKGLKASSEYEVSWAPLAEQSIKEGAESRKAQAETDAIYLDKGILTPEEVRRSRFENGYSYDTSVSGELDEDLYSGAEEEETE